VLVAKAESELALDVDDDAMQWVKVLLETVKLLLLTVVLPMTAVTLINLAEL
jgi:hypothetical protein